MQRMYTTSGRSSACGKRQSPPRVRRRPRRYGHPAGLDAATRRQVSGRSHTSGGAHSYAAAACACPGRDCPRVWSRSPRGARRKRRLRRSRCARPNIWRFSILRRLICPSTGPLRPGQGHAGFDGRIVVAEPARKALHGLQRTGASRAAARDRGARAAAGARGCVKSCARSIASATSADCAWSWVSCWASASVRLRRTSQHQPRRPARRQGLGRPAPPPPAGVWRRPWRRGGMPWAWRMRLT